MNEIILVGGRSLVSEEGGTGVLKKRSLQQRAGRTREDGEQNTRV